MRQDRKTVLIPSIVKTLGHPAYLRNDPLDFSIVSQHAIRVGTSPGGYWAFIILQLDSYIGVSLSRLSSLGSPSSDGVGIEMVVMVLRVLMLWKCCTGYSIYSV